MHTTDTCENAYSQVIPGQLDLIGSGWASGTCVRTSALGEINQVWKSQDEMEGL